MFTSTNKATESPQKNVIEKSRDFIHEKTGTEEQLLKEKPMHEQISAKMPNSTKEAAEKLEATVKNTVDDVKTKLNERLDEGTERAAEHQQQQKDDHPSGQNVITQKIFEATKSPEVKEREEFRQKPFVEKVKDIAKQDAKMAPDQTVEEILE